MIKDPKNQNQTQHINIIHNHVKRLVKDGELLVEWILNSMMLVDNLTKAFPIGSFKRHQDK